MKAQLTIKDWELLSAYRDGELSKAECKKLEKRLQSDQVLRNALSDLGITHELLGCLPRKQVPYHFTLTRAMLPQGSRWALPLSLGFSLASVSSLVLILLTFTMQLLPAAKVSLEAMPEAEMAQDSAVNEEVAGESPLIVWGTPGAAPEAIGGYGGGAEQPYVGSGGAETYMQSTPVAISTQAMVLPSTAEEARDEQSEENMETATLMEEAASPTMAKEESTAESALMQGAPVEEMVQEEEAHVLQATSMPNVAEQAVSEDSPILGVRPADENEISTASASDADTLRTYDGSQHAWLDWRNPIFWVRLGLAAVAVASAVIAIYFVRKIRS